MLLSFFVKANAQDYSLIKTIPIAAENIAVDKFDFLYIVENYKVSKFDKLGNLLFTYEDLSQGEITHFDVSNPLKPLVYYKDFNVLRILDNKLSSINTINLFDKNLNFINAICAANTMEYWVYDEIDNKLRQVDKNFNTTDESETFFTLFDKLSPVVKLQISNNKLYVLDLNGIKVFDLSGSFKTQYPIANLLDFQIFGEEIVYLEDNLLKSFNENNKLSKEIDIEKLESEVRDVKILKGEMIYLTQKAVYIFQSN